LQYATHTVMQNVCVHDCTSTHYLIATFLAIMYAIKSAIVSYERAKRES